MERDKKGRFVKGYKPTIKDIDKLKEAKKEYFKNNYSWNKGISSSKETKRKIKETAKNNPNFGMRGKHQSDYAKKILSIIQKGKHINPKTEFKKGRVPWNKGIHTNPNQHGLKKYYETHSAWNKGLPPQMQSNWKGGLSFLPYPITFNKQFKQMIRERDNFTCLKCNILEYDSKILYKQVLHIHHIDYNKSLTIPENCCALCIRCNLEVNSNRKQWTQFFQSLLAERYDYKYSSNGDITFNIVNNNNTYKHKEI